MPPLGHPHPHPSPFTGYPCNAIIDRLHNRTVHAPGRPSLHSVPLQMPSSTDSQPHNPRTVSPWERAISCNQCRGGREETVLDQSVGKDDQTPLSRIASDQTLLPPLARGLPHRCPAEAVAAPHTSPPHTRAAHWPLHTSTTHPLSSGSTSPLTSSPYHPSTHPLHTHPGRGHVICPIQVEVLQ